MESQPKYRMAVVEIITEIRYLQNIVMLQYMSVLQYKFCTICTLRPKMLVHTIDMTYYGPTLVFSSFNTSILKYRDFVCIFDDESYLVKVEYQIWSISALIRIFQMKFLIQTFLRQFLMFILKMKAKILLDYYEQSKIIVSQFKIKNDENLFTLKLKNEIK